MYSRSNSDPSELWSGLSQLAIELSIPACGYYGALYGHRTLIFFFCGANLIFIVASAIGFFRLLVVLGSSSRNMCKQEYASAKSTCEIMLGDGPEKYMLLSSLALLTVLGCLSFVAGKRLYQSLHPFDLSSMPSGADRVPLVGEVIASGPGLNQSSTPAVIAADAPSNRSAPDTGGQAPFSGAVIVPATVALDQARAAPEVEAVPEVAVNIDSTDYAADVTDVDRRDQIQSSRNEDRGLAEDEAQKKSLFIASGFTSAPPRIEWYLPPCQTSPICSGMVNGRGEFVLLSTDDYVSDDGADQDEEESAAPPLSKSSLLTIALSGVVGLLLALCIVSFEVSHARQTAHHIVPHGALTLADATLRNLTQLPGGCDGGC